MAIADECGAGLGGVFETADFDVYLDRAAKLFPFEADPLWFRAVSARPDEMRNMDQTRFGFFTSRRPSNPEMVKNILKTALLKGQSKVETIHLILFPELSARRTRAHGA